MGKVATELSDFTVITTDNPRTENPESIINDILTGIDESTGSYKVIVNRREAINEALRSLETGDVLILAGKGHETYQIIGNDKIFFDDREVVAEYLKKIRIESRKQPSEDID